MDERRGWLTSRRSLSGSSEEDITVKMTSWNSGLGVDSGSLSAMVATVLISCARNFTWETLWKLMLALSSLRLARVLG